MALLDWLLGRTRRSHEVDPALPPPLGRSNDEAEGEDEEGHEQEELDLEEGALDPDELVGDPLVWDEGADDELG